MDFKSFTKLLKKRTEGQKDLLKELTQDYLKFFDLSEPKKKQVLVLENLIFRRFIYDDFTFHYPLSSSELKTLYLASEGYDIRETAMILHVSIRQIENLRSTTIQKLNCKNMMHSVKKAMEKRLIS